MKKPNQIKEDIGTYPYDDSSRLIASADLEIRSFADVVEQELKEVIGFFLLETNNGLCEPQIDVESLLASHRVDTNNGVLGLDWFPANRAVTFPGELGLGDGGVQCPETFEALLEFRRETIVGLNLGQE